MTTVNWNEIFENCERSVVEQFANGEMSVREFASTCTEARKATRMCGAENARQRASMALRRRLQKQGN